MIVVEKVSSFSEGLRGQWRKLLKDVDQSTVFMEFDWLKNWWQNFSEWDDELFILLAKEKNQLIGIAPFCTKKHILPFPKILRFVAIEQSDYCNFILKKDWEKKILRAIFSYCRGRSIASIELEHFPQESICYQIIKDLLGKAELKGIDKIQAVAPYLSLQGKGSSVEGISRNVVHQRRHLTKLGRLEFGLCGDLDEAYNYLKILIDFHVNRRKKKNSDLAISQYFLNRSRRLFYKKILSNFFTKDKVNLVFLSLNGHPIACFFLLIYAKKILGYTMTYNKEFAKYSPGMVLIYELIKYGHDHYFKELDFGYGDEPYKYRWTKTERRLRAVRLFFQTKQLVGWLEKSKWLGRIDKLILNPKKTIFTYIKKMIKETVLWLF